MSENMAMEQGTNFIIFIFDFGWYKVDTFLANNVELLRIYYNK